MPETLKTILVHYLTDTYSIEQQSLAQLRTAPEIAGGDELARVLREHLPETEHQAEALAQRLTAHGGSPSRAKDAIMSLGGKGFVLFARVQPDTPGKLAAHAYSYEAMEWGAYEMLLRAAEAAGDEATARAARSIQGQERSMMERLAGRFDEAAEASLRAQGDGDPQEHLPTYLADAHALEAQSIQLLEKGPDLAGTPELERIYRDHLDETREQARRVEERLDSLDGEVSTLKDLALRAAGLNWGAFFQAQSDTPGKLAVFAYAFEHLEIAGYELLRRVAERAGDEPTTLLAEQILVQERAMAERLAGSFDLAFEASLVARGAVLAAPVGTPRA